MELEKQKLKKSSNGKKLLSVFRKSLSRNSSGGSTKTSSSLDTMPLSANSDEGPFFTPIPKHLYPCPALNCPKYLELDDILPHLMEIHNFVKSNGNDHSNILECGLNATNIFRPENSAAWSPTLLEFEGEIFFMEAFREEIGNWAMWVYSASTKIDEYLSIIHVEKEDLKLNWSGPVQDLKLHKSQVIKSGSCLTFTDNFARNLIEKVDEETYGISYRVQIQKKMENQTKL